MRDIELFAKKRLEAAVMVGKPSGLNGVAEAVQKPEFATAVGLAMMAAEDGQYMAPAGKKGFKKAKNKNSGEKKSGLLKKIFGKF